MIDARDLMLDNLFSYENCIYKAKVIRDNFVYGTNINGFAPGEFPIEKIKPIFITEDILVNNCGFKKLGRYTFYRSTFKIHKRKRGFVIRKSIPMIDYLHQLQIAYKVFTGKELEIKL